jgi:hypothetical protein
VSRHPHTPAAVAAVLLFGLRPASACRAQTAATRVVSANFESTREVSGRDAIEVTLSRPVAAAEGELVLVVGGMDVTAVSDRSASSIRWHPTAQGLAQGETDVVVYARTGNRWTELRRFSVRVAEGARGFAFSSTKTATVGNKGQLAEGRSGGVPVPDRRVFQDFVLNGGLQSKQERGRWSLATQSNYVGVTRREEALRFATQGRRAPMLDLADYLVTLHAPAMSLSVGHVSFGASRHLANGFAARGLTATFDRGPTSLTLGALNGAMQVGWTNMVGLEQPANRVFGVSLGRELVPAHPGSLRFDLTLLDGAKLPLSSFTQSSVVDAERSDGGSVQMTAALPNQRVRFTGGYSRSRFENPARDPQLLPDSIRRRPAAVTRGARFVEISSDVLRQAHVPVAGPTTLTFGVRDERVDPLYGSVAAIVNADRQQDAADMTLTLGAIAAQVSQGWTRDNLARVASVLTTDGRSTTANVAVPLPMLFATATHAPRPWLPTLTVALNRMHQFADGTPTNGAFRPTDLPDQVNVNGDASASWQTSRLRVTLHANQSVQDNREDQRQNADFEAGVYAVSVGTPIATAGDLSLDLGHEYQTSRERDETTRTKRLTLNGTLRPRGATGVAMAWSIVDTHPPIGSSSVNTEQRLELSQGVNLGLGGDASGAPRGQLFVRYARTASLLPDATILGVPSIAPRVSRAQWTVSSGFTVRVF